MCNFKNLNGVNVYHDFISFILQCLRDIVIRYFFLLMSYPGGGSWQICLTASWRKCFQSVCNVPAVCSVFNNEGVCSSRS